MKSIRLKELLPERMSGDSPEITDARQITIVGGAAAGKSLFMQEMIRRCGDKAYCLSAMSASFPDREISTSPGSIDMQYREAMRAKSYMRHDAVCELDKLAYMLYVDEFETLLKIKEMHRQGQAIKMRPTRLDKLTQLWERIFPGNRVVCSSDRLMFATKAGEDLVGIGSLSQGETAVLYYIAAVLYARRDSIIFINEPTLLIHPSVVSLLWDSLEALRPDCRFVYDTVDVDFVSSRTENACVWVKSYDSASKTWDYEVVPSSRLREDLLVGLLGTRKPVLFIEGDVEHSIDAKLYRLVFTDYSVRPLGSCNKVIETTRTFNDLKYLHHLESHGIVDRDRRSQDEVLYLRRKSIFVPDVAEVENIFLLPGVIEVMSRRRGRDAKKVLRNVKHSVLRMFASHYDEQALQHVRHKVKRDVECRIDGRFSCITAMETHLMNLLESLQPRKEYIRLRNEFNEILASGDYEGVLRVFNHKPMLGNCGVARELGYASTDEYIAGVLGALKGNDHDSLQLRTAIKYCFGLKADDSYFEPLPEPEPKKKIVKDIPAQEIVYKKKGKKEKGAHKVKSENHKSRSKK